MGKPWVNTVCFVGVTRCLGLKCPRIILAYIEMEWWPHMYVSISVGDSIEETVEHISFLYVAAAVDVEAELSALFY